MTPASLKQRLTRFQPYLIALAITMTGLFAYLGSSTNVLTRFMESISLKTIDLRFQVRGNIPTGDHVVIAAIDEKSLKHMGKWPWPRSTMAELITKASDAGVRVIAFDVGFFEADDRRIQDTLIRLKTTLEKESPACVSILDRLSDAADNDALFARAIHHASSQVVLGHYFNLKHNEIVDESPEDLADYQDRISSSQVNQMNADSEQAIQNAGLLEALNIQPNIPILCQSTEYSGFFNMPPDPDGIYRSVPGVIAYRDFYYLPLSLSAIHAWTGKPVILNINQEAGISTTSIDIGDYHIPVGRNGEIMVNFRGGDKTFPHVSIVDILAGNVDKKLIGNKIMVVGATSAGLSDIRPIPFSPVFAGCEIHANLIDSILSGDLLYHPPLVGLWSILAIALAGVILAICLPHLGAVTGLALYATLAVFYWGLCQYLFSSSGLILDMTYPLTVLTLTYIAVTANRYMTESRKKKFINDAFSTYLAPSVVKQLIRDPEKLGLGGEDREITAFFSDVQGFTSISEQLSPKELVKLLNEFLTEMTNIILDYEGTVDKFEGDAIIAFFGAPNTLSNHAQATCEACIAMHERLAELNETWKQENRPQLFMRIGLCSGTAVVGNMGSVNRMDYTMMGDVVNTAARLEGVNKIYGTYSMISETTRNMAGSAIVTREIDTIFMVGKYEPVTIYQIIGRPGTLDPLWKETLDLYAKGLVLYKNKAFKTALAHFEKALTLTPDDGPSKTLADRCREFLSNPPGESWNGVYRITSK